MSKNKIVLAASLLSVALSSPTFAGEGNGVGNGGDVASCTSSAGSPFSGNYSLDYLVTYRKTNGNADLVPVQSWETSRDRILTQLKAKAPKIAESFEHFSQLMINYSDYSQEAIWEEASFGLIDLKDENLIRLLPSNCLNGGSSSGDPKLKQAVIRTSQPGITVYQFDTDLYTSLRKNAPMQFSFLMVHEWLWSISNDVDVNRKVNRLLHSESLEAFDAEQLKLNFINLGINPNLETPVAPKPVPSPSAKFQCQAYGVSKLDSKRLSNYTSQGVTRGDAFEGLTWEIRNYEYEVLCVDYEMNSQGGYSCKKSATPENACWPIAQ